MPSILWELGNWAWPHPWDIHIHLDLYLETCQYTWTTKTITQMSCLSYLFYFIIVFFYFIFLNFKQDIWFSCKQLQYLRLQWCTLFSLVYHGSFLLRSVFLLTLFCYFYPSVMILQTLMWYDGFYGLFQNGFFFHIWTLFFLLQKHCFVDIGFQTKVW